MGTAAKSISPMAMHVKAFQVRQFLEEEVGLEDCSFPVNARDTKDWIPSEDRSPRRNPSISNSAWTRIDVNTKREGDASQYDMLDS